MNSVLLVHVLQKTITLYQGVLSPDHGFLRALFPEGVCRYQPTCSEYMKDALEQHGLLGLKMGLKRISRCHPWHKGGSDPVPSKQK